MAILKVARMGHPILRKKARKLEANEIGSELIQRLIRDMIETMHEYSGIGLAAPQVHESLQLAIIEIEPDNPRYPDAEKKPLTVFINPKITV
ncbi:MAG: peptide deformylase, partial [Bdellovibrionota bacterium]